MVAVAFVCFLIVSVVYLHWTERSRVEADKRALRSRELLSVTNLVELFRGDGCDGTSGDARLLEFLDRVARAKEVEVGRLRPTDLLGASPSVRAVFEPFGNAVDDAVEFDVLRAYDVEFPEDVLTRSLSEVFAMIEVADVESFATVASVLVPPRADGSSARAGVAPWRRGRWLAIPLVGFLLGFGPCTPEFRYGFPECDSDLATCVVSGGCAYGASCCTDVFPGVLGCFVISDSNLSFDEEDVAWLVDESQPLTPSCLVLLNTVHLSENRLPMVSEASILRSCFESRFEADPCNGGVDIGSCENFSDQRLLGDPMCEKYYAFWDSLQVCIDKNGPQELLTGECFTVFRIDDYGSSCGPYTCHVWEDPSCLDEPY